MEIVVVDHTLEAAQRAAKIGLIFTEALPEIEREKKKDKGEIEEKEEITVTP